VRRVTLAVAAAIFVLGAVASVLIYFSFEADAKATVDVGGVKIEASGNVKIIVPCVGTTVPNSGTAKKAPSAFSRAWAKITKAPLFRYLVYALSGILAAFAFQWLKAKFAWEGKKALTLITVLCAVLGVGTTALFKDGSVSAIVSNPWNIAAGGSVAFTLAQLAFKLWIKR
jgi:hypothetical protein